MAIPPARGRASIAADLFLLVLVFGSSGFTLEGHGMLPEVAAQSAGCLQEPVLLPAAYR